MKQTRRRERGFSLLGLKLFALLALVSILCVGAVSWLFARHLEAGFTGYLNEVQSARLDAIGQAVTTYYQSYGSLDGLRGPEWRRIVGGRDEPPKGDRPPPKGDGPPRKGDRPPPKWDRPPDKLEGPPPKGHKGPPPAASDDVLSLGPRVSLEDAEGFRLAGRRPPAGEQVTTKEIKVDGVTIARLVVAPLPRPIESRDIQFLRAQRQSILLAGAAAVAISLVIGMVVAGLWVRRMRTLSAAAARFADGKFEARLNDRHRDEIGGLARSLDTMADSLARLEQARRKWLADIAHELRTPLTVLQGQVEALIDGVRPMTPEALQALAVEVKQLTRLTDDLHQLALSDLKALPAEFRPVNAAAVAKLAVERWQPNARQAGLSLTYAGLEELPVSADEGRLTQLLDNLLANSLRYTDRPGEVKLSADKAAGNARFVLDDSPPSVPTEALASIFEPLFRPDAARSRSKGGSGLGLALARAIVELHGGRIEAFHAPLGGLRVVVSIPLSRPV